MIKSLLKSNILIKNNHLFDFALILIACFILSHYRVVTISCLNSRNGLCFLFRFKKNNISLDFAYFDILTFSFSPSILSYRLIAFFFFLL